MASKWQTACDEDCRLFFFYYTLPAPMNDVGAERWGVKFVFKNLWTAIVMPSADKLCLVCRICARQKDQQKKLGEPSCRWCNCLTTLPALNTQRRRDVLCFAKHMQWQKKGSTSAALKTLLWLVPKYAIYNSAGCVNNSRLFLLFPKRTGKEKPVKWICHLIYFKF